MQNINLQKASQELIEIKALNYEADKLLEKINELYTKFKNFERNQKAREKLGQSAEDIIKKEEKKYLSQTNGLLAQKTELERASSKKQIEILDLLQNATIADSQDLFTFKNCISTLFKAKLTSNLPNEYLQVFLLRIILTQASQTPNFQTILQELAINYIDQNINLLDFILNSQQSSKEYFWLTKTLNSIIKCSIINEDDDLNKELITNHIFKNTDNLTKYFALNTIKSYKDNFITSLIKNKSIPKDFRKELKAHYSLFLSQNKEQIKKNASQNLYFDDENSF